MTVTSEQYADMLMNFALLDQLKLAFPSCVISRNGDIPWPTCSPDLMAPDFFFGDRPYLKFKVFEANPSRTKNKLKE